MLREQLARNVAGVILDSVKDNGLKRKISEDIGINRREFNRKSIAGMKLHRLLRILVGLAFYMGIDRWEDLWMQIGSYIFEISEFCYFDFCDERRKQK